MCELRHYYYVYKGKEHFMNISTSRLYIPHDYEVRVCYKDAYSMIMNDPFMLAQCDNEPVVITRFTNPARVLMSCRSHEWYMFG